MSKSHVLPGDKPTPLFAFGTTLTYNIGMMTRINLPYGKASVQLDIPSDWGLEIDIIEPPQVEASPTPLKLVTEAIHNPPEGSNLSLFRHVKKVAIAISDKTRPVPHNYLLPPLLSYLKGIGISASAIKLVIANGTHTPMQKHEYPLVVPPTVYREYEIISHDCDDSENLEFLGVTSRGTPVFINKIYYGADLRIAVGNIEPHHFMGFSGGNKAVAIGLGGRQTIQANHSMLLDPRSCLASFETNPMRMDVEEIGGMVGVHFALNAILNEERKISRVFFGKPEDVMKAGIMVSRQSCQVKVTGQYDLVIASAGGYPKDINLYQAQKALTNASYLVRKEGIIILVAACPEGSGSTGYEKFMQDINTVEDIFAKFNAQGFRIGPHKALLFGRVLKRAKVIMVSSMEDHLVSKFLLSPASNLQKAFQIAMGELQTSRPRIAIMPHATITVPEIE